MVFTTQQQGMLVLMNLSHFYTQLPCQHFFWEYGVEAFAEIPSWQDIFVTPFFGAVVGEIMLEQEQDIIDSGGEVLGSIFVGDITLFLLNPVGHIHGWVSNALGGSAEFTYLATLGLETLRQPICTRFWR